MLKPALAIVEELMGLLRSAVTPKPAAADRSPMTAPSNMSAENTVRRVAPKTRMTLVSRQRSRELKKVMAPIVSVVAAPAISKSTTDRRLTTLTMSKEMLVIVSTRS